MPYSIRNVFFIGVYFLIFLIGLVHCVEKWNMHELCGQTMEGYGAEINFDARKLPPGARRCKLTIIGVGQDDYMLSLYFSSFNVTPGCLENVTFVEEAERGKGLYHSFCRSSPYLNEYSIYTTNGRVMSLVYTQKVASKPASMSFLLKYVTFMSRVTGCTEDEIEQHGMFTCGTGRCVHESLVCKDLNPCGDRRDCADNQPLRTDEEGAGLGYIKVVVIAVVLVFTVFALIQICLIVRNEHTACSRKDPTVRIDAELMTVEDMEPTKYRQNGYERASNRNNADDRLISREPV